MTDAPEDMDPEDRGRDDTDTGDDNDGGLSLDSIKKSFIEAFSGSSAPASTDNASGKKPADFFRAVRLNKIDTVKSFLDDGFNPNTYDKNGETALHVAAKKNALPMAKLLIERGADPSIGRKEQPTHTPLEDAINHNKPEMAAFLAPFGLFEPEDNDGGWSLTHRACERNAPKLVMALIEAGADPNEQTKDGSTLLMVAIRHGKQQAADALLGLPQVQRGINDYSEGEGAERRTAFQLAVEKGMVKLAEKMLDLGALIDRPDGQGHSPIARAVMQKDIEMVRLLVARGAELNPSSDGISPLERFESAATPREAEKTKNAAIAELLIAGGAGRADEAPAPAPKPRKTLQPGM